LKRILQIAASAAVLAAFGYLSSVELTAFGAETNAAVAAAPRPSEAPTFNKNIAPIIFWHCAGCHRSGQAAPFSLLSYPDVKKHAEDIASVTSRRYMPPWLPEHGYAQFADERRLNDDEIGMIQRWVAQGAVEGEGSELPPVPHWTGDWQLGKPDLVVTMPQPYTLAAQGRDVYQNFVVRVPLDRPRFIRGVEFHPGNPNVVHHAFVKVDTTGQSRRLDAQDAEVGFGGMNSPAKSVPGGHFLGWQPGRIPTFLPDGLAWRLDPGTDLVLEMHLNPSGKPEQVQSSVGLYFTDKPPTNAASKITLLSMTMDIPAGAQEYAVEDSFQLPVDVQVLAVLPHAHYLAKEMKGWATLPNGTQQPLLWIKQWDFNWQGDYRYAPPIFLPKGSVMSMRYTYDNSTNNTRNPNRPPKPVTYGLQSRDEMAELWFQLLPKNPSDLARLEAVYQDKQNGRLRTYYEFLLAKNPNDAVTLTKMGINLLSANQTDQAETCLRAAVRSQPDYALAHYCLGLLLRTRNKLGDARAEFERALELDPTYYKSHGNLGIVCLELGDLESAKLHFESALKLNPDDTLAREGLDKVRHATGRQPTQP
jgi:Flp pilus assembly protein TadD/mono/diheme cytochrome c family protein